MSTLHVPNRSTAALTANDLSAYIETMIGTLGQRIVDDQREIERIGGLTLRYAEPERLAALKPSQDKLQAYQLSVDELGKEYFGFGWLCNRKNTKAAKAQRDEAKAQHDLVVDNWDARAAQAQLTMQIAQHNKSVSQQQLEVPGIQQQLRQTKQLLQEFEAFKIASADALAAASCGAWLAGGFAAMLQDIDARVRRNQLAMAMVQVGTLVFQRRPTAAGYASLQGQAQAIRDKAYLEFHGVPATGAFDEIVKASATLAAANMQPAFAQELLHCPGTGDQWQLLTQILTWPQTLSVDVLWTIYWAMLQCEDEMAKFMSGTVAKEDPLNGRFSKSVEDWLARWASQQIPAFGYPLSQSYLGTFHLAGTSEESRLGADIGVIISLNVGGLVCRKAVLLQAKRAKDWVANVGSDKDQLTKLSANVLTGYYLFYHESPKFKVAPPVPTVSSALALQQLLQARKRVTTGASILLDVRDTGWDWASFITFGLCDPQSTVGAHFDTVDEAFTILGNKETGELPHHLFLVAIEDEGHVRDLEAQLRKRYEPAEPEKKTRAKKRDKDGPDHSRSL